MSDLITAVEEALIRWHEEQNQPNSHIPVLNAIADACRANAPVLVPVLIPEDALEGIDQEKLKAGESVHIDHEIRMQIQHLAGKDGGHFIPLFTSEAEIAKGTATSTVSQGFAAMLECALQEEGCEGIVLNPWDKSVTLPRDVLQRIHDATAPSEDEKAIRQVLLAYLRGSNRGDSSILKPAFHRDAVIFWDGAPSDVHTHAIQWFFDAIDGAGPDPDENAPWNIQILDITGGLAVAKIQELWKGTAYTDYFTLVRTEEGWKITAKLFHNHSRDQKQTEV